MSQRVYIATYGYQYGYPPEMSEEENPKVMGNAVLVFQALASGVRTVMVGQKDG